MNSSLRGLVTDEDTVDIGEVKNEPSDEKEENPANDVFVDGGNQLHGDKILASSVAFHSEIVCSNWDICYHFYAEIAL